MAGLTPLTVTAVLQQGVSMDLRYGIALDGLLVGQVRAQAAHRTSAFSGSLLDGGLAEPEPEEWDIPLGKCTLSEDWHWLCTTGMPQDFHGRRVHGTPDTHRLLGDLDERRAEQVSIALPKNVGGARGRFRRRTTPVLVFPAAQVVWRAIGDVDAVRVLLEGVTTIGARRGSGEGTVLQWRVEASDTHDNEFTFAHTHLDGIAGRPMPTACAEKAGLPTHLTGVAGIRPPMFHAGRQKVLVLPDLALVPKETPHATS